MTELALQLNALERSRLADLEVVVEIVKRIDAAMEAERLSFVADLDTFLAERSAKIGETVAPLVDELRDLADALPEDGLELARHFTFASGGTGIRGDIRDCFVADKLTRKQGLA